MRRLFDTVSEDPTEFIPSLASRDCHRIKCSPRGKRRQKSRDVGTGDAASKPGPAPHGRRRCGVKSPGRCASGAVTPGGAIGADSLLVHTPTNLNPPRTCRQHSTWKSCADTTKTRVRPPVRNQQALRLRRVKIAIA
ncbi:hypothetical protein LZ31DRAFT_76506 [Colletotrichum somersetense]|nr:hypothetical protein LZ31DRAFT_76506 [Colletotrichum somersetense]